MTNYRWLLFDADDTLFDFHSAQDFSLTKTLVHFGLEPTPERKERFKTINAGLWAEFDRGNITQEALVVERYARFLAQEGVEGDPAAWNDYGLHALAENPVLIPGAERLCRSLSEKYTLALVTNGVSYVQRARLEASPLARYFGKRVYISGEMGCRKPEKRFFDLVLEDLGATKNRSQVLVIGDSLSSDITGAFNARLDSVWLHWPGVKAGVVRPTYEVDSLAQLSKLLGCDRLVPLSLSDFRS